MSMYVIRPISLGAELFVEARNWRDAVMRFSATVCLEAFNLYDGRDDDGIEYITFTLGSGRKFICFEKQG